MLLCADDEICCLLLCHQCSSTDPAVNGGIKVFREKVTRAKLSQCQVLYIKIALHKRAGLAPFLPGKNCVLAVHGQGHAWTCLSIGKNMHMNNCTRPAPAFRQRSALHAFSTYVRSRCI